MIAADDFAFSKKSIAVYFVMYLSAFIESASRTSLAKTENLLNQAKNIDSASLTRCPVYKLISGTLEEFYVYLNIVNSSPLSKRI